ncbi:DUF6705 family protein [Psychroflexus tropicus]|uniref:DUF6705 family protein n=1 Tax=Psychroflexus tropicus TaxID=197345 RepID=UPI00038057BC|nr:DUF6705 family protein [Psychroflexus tropicus]
MKTLISILILFISSIHLAQEIIPLEDFGSYRDKEGKYFKDPSGPLGILDAYTGVWRWTEGNRELIFYLYKQEAATLQSSTQYLSDVIVGYYIYKENGEELINTRQDLIDKYDLYDGKMMLSRGGIGMAPRTRGYDANTAPPFYFRDHSVLVCYINDIYVPMQGTPGSWRFINPTTAKVGLPRKSGGFFCGPEVVVHPNFPSSKGITIHKIADEAPPLD